MRTKQQWPYTNLSLDDLPGEMWDDVPGFDGEYQVSSYGRIKSLRRWQGTGSSGRGYYTKEKIRQQHILHRRNTILNIPAHNISIALYRNARPIWTSTARYVYCVFVEPFDIDNPDIIISYKDCDGRNLHYENLILTDRSKLATRSFRLKRNRSIFSLDSLPVRQLTMEGELIATYPSLKAAQDKTGIHYKSIEGCIYGRFHQLHGFRWESPAVVKPLPSQQSEPDAIFNEFLWNALGRPRTSKKSPIPVLNLSLTDMKGERWKPIEGMEGRYLISDYGRVKGCPGMRGHVWRKEYIQKLGLAGYAGGSVYRLMAQLGGKDKKYGRSVARLVYHHFVKKIDLADKSLRLRYRNGKFWDLHWKNLYI